MTLTSEEKAEIARRLEMTTPRREAQPLVNHFLTPYDAFPFVGDGPFYEFEVYEWTGVSPAAAQNYFHRINAVVVQHDRRSFRSDGCERCPYDYFLVRWQEQDHQVTK